MFRPRTRRAAARPSPLRLERLDERAVPAVLSDNLSAVTNDAETAAGNTWLASSFATGGAAYTLDNVALKIANTTAGSAAVAIYADDGNEPGPLVGTLTDPASYSPTLADTTFTGGVSLAANTTYWVVLKAASGAFTWGFTNANDGTGAGFQHTFGQTSDAGTTWFTYDIFPTQMQVNATAAGGTTTGRGKLTAAGAGSGSPTVSVYAGDGSLVRTIAVFESTFTGGVRAATADVSGDGTDDVIAGAGPGGAAVVKVYDGASGSLLAAFTAFEAAFAGGVFVATADVTGDGKADVVVSPDQGGGPVVALYNGAALATGTATQISRFFGIDDTSFRGGARPALGDVNGDGFADLVVSAGFLGGPRVAIYTGADLAKGSATPARLVNDFFAFEQTLRNGAFVAAADVTGDGRADLAFGGGPGGGPRVRLVDGAKLLAAGGFTNLDDVAGTVQRANFFAGDGTARGGVRLAFDDINTDGAADLVTGSGEGEESRVRVYLSPTLLGGSTTPDRDFDPFAAVLANGVFVG